MKITHQQVLIATNSTEEKKSGEKSPRSASPSASSPRPSSHSNLTPISTQFSTSEPTKLHLEARAKGFSGDEARIKDSNDETVFRIRAETVSFSQRRTMIDVDGNAVAQLRHKVMDIVPTIYIGTPSNEKKAKIKATDTFDASNNNASISVDGMRVGVVNGNGRGDKFRVQVDGADIATIRRIRTTTSTYAGGDPYDISVTPRGRPVDLAFVSLVAVALDELYHWTRNEDYHWTRNKDRKTHAKKK